MPYVETTEGVKIHYEERGKGRPVLFIHGWCMSSQVWFFQRELADEFRLITLDLRGHGRSSTPSYGFGFADFAADLPHILSSLELENVVVVAWSMGVEVTLKAFDAIKDRLAALVFVDGTPKFIDGDVFPAGLPGREVRGMQLRLKRNYEETMREFIRRMFAEGELSWDSYKKVHRNILAQSALPELHVAFEALQSLEKDDLRPILPHINLPVLLIHGELDTICLPSASKYMADEILLSKLVIMEGAGHAPFISQRDSFNAILRDYLLRPAGR